MKNKTGKNQILINNNKLRDNSSKLIFSDNILSSQFLRDYADMDILRYIQPEDIEDVSERYVPLYSTERESDTVKKVNISKYLNLTTEEKESLNPLDLPLYVISLVEHKTKVEYNVAMQLLRYMVHIWEDYEKEMNRLYPGISSRKDFRYPPILPIVYYEGTAGWTAPLDLADRILCGELLGKYLPHFQYQLITLHSISNTDLLAKGDEISLAMLINKIQTPEDMSAFVGLSGEQVDGILKDTPEHLLDILSKVFRALLYNMHLPENEVENAVARIKERKMGRLFENVTMDIQAERRNTAEARAELQSAFEKLDAMQQEMNLIQQERDSAQQKCVSAQQERDSAQQERDIYRHILRMTARHCPDTEILDSLMQNFRLTKTQAAEMLKQACEE